jgi:hypothetical protein
MRFLETLLLMFAAIYVAQLVIASLIVATLMLFLWCLYKRPREALVLGLAALAVVVISKPIGLVLVLVAILGFGLWAFIGHIQTTRSGGAGCGPSLLPPPDRGGG